MQHSIHFFNAENDSEAKKNAHTTMDGTLLSNDVPDSTICNRARNRKTAIGCSIILNLYTSKSIPRDYDSKKKHGRSPGSSSFQQPSRSLPVAIRVPKCFIYGITVAGLLRILTGFPINSHPLIKDAKPYFSAKLSTFLLK